MRNGPPGEDALAEEDEAFSSCEDPRGADENIFPKNDIVDALKGSARLWSFSWNFDHTRSRMIGPQ
jgi:hypothetical protein